MHPLIDTRTLLQRLGEPNVRVIDVRFSLADTEAGRRAHAAGHVPGAVYLHLDDDLSAALGAHGGRHPLPTPEAAAATFERAGIGDDTQVVVLDDGDGMVAARVWWMLRWLGHDAVQLLDGGMAAWRDVGGPVTRQVDVPEPARLTVRLRPEMTVDRDWMLRHGSDPDVALLDARAPERYRGDVEPIDPVAGHVPGALNTPYADHLEGGRFLGAEALQRRYAGVTDRRTLVTYCGSGVSAAHVVLALELAGVPGVKLYPGSWSDWVSYPDAPVERGSGETPDRDD
jgi:thiosulfate/3-mercaptopyruvate sulfurtransferase